MPTISETRSVSNFSEIALQGYGDLTIEQNPDAPESLVIEADQDLMSRLTSEVRDSRLILGFDMPWYDWLGWGLEWLFTPNKAIRYHISLKTFTGVALSGAANLSATRLRSEGACKLVVSGAGKIRIGELQAQLLATTISGSGDIEIGAGSALQHDLHISGSGSVKVVGLQTAETRVNVSGAGSADVNASQTLTVHISGAGSVRYTGSPVVNQQISGAGSIKPLH
jgi:hypothetical protein